MTTLNALSIALQHILVELTRFREAVMEAGEVRSADPGSLTLAFFFARIGEALLAQVRSLRKLVLVHRDIDAKL